MPNISLVKRHMVIERHNQARNQTDIAKSLQISRRSVQEIIKKHSQGLPLTDKPRTGRPKLLTARTENRIAVSSKRNPFLTANEIRYDLNLQHKASLSTVKRVLRSHNLFGRVSIKKPSLNKKQKAKRLKWCTDRILWDATNWKKVIFSDECKLELHSKSRKYVRRPKSSQMNPRYITGTQKFSPSIMVFGAIRGDGKRILVKAESSVDSKEYQRILEIALPRVYNTRFLFQQDGATCHTSKSTKAYLERKSIRMISDWPPQSADLNIIENLWDYLKEKIKQRAPKSLNELWQTALSEFESIPNSKIEHLFESLPNRIKAAKEVRGGNTKY